MVVAMALLIYIGAGAQTTQIHIGDPRNQLATHIKVMATGEKIIAGYDYDLVAGEVANAQMILMKVDAAGSTIIWQEKFGMPGTNNLVYDMILTIPVAATDGDIVVVGSMGRNNVYADNHAAILKFRSSDGSLVWQKIIRDPDPADVGGEVFSAVTALSDGRLVAVGTHDARPHNSNAMIYVFSAMGVPQYNEIDGMTESDGYLGITTDGTDCYITGTWVGNYTDARVHKYTPAAVGSGMGTFGVMGWSRYFDFTLTGVKGDQALQDNFFTDIYLVGGELMILGGSLHNYLYGAGEGESICRLNASGLPDITTEGLWQIQNSGMTYSGAVKMAVVDRNHIYNVQSPTNVWTDPIIWLAGTSNNTVVTDISLLPSGTAPVVSNTVLYKSFPPSLHSLFDMAMVGSDLQMAGSTNDPLHGYGNNDIYFVKTANSLPVGTNPKVCDSRDVAWGDAFPLVESHQYFTRSYFNPVFTNVFPVSTFYQIGPLVCDDSTKHQPCTDSSKLVITSTTDANGNCIFSATAYVWTANEILGYEWQGAGPAQIDHTHATSDTYTFTVTPGGTAVIKVTVFVVDTTFIDTVSGPCCSVVLTQTVTCNHKDSTYCGCFDTSLCTLTYIGMSGHDGKCHFTVTANQITNKGCQFLGYKWITSSFSTGIISSNTGTVIVNPGTTGFATVVFYALTPAGDTCVFTRWVKLICPGDVGGPGCFNTALTTLTATSVPGFGGSCNFTCTASATTIPPYVVTSYRWYKNSVYDPTYTTNTFPVNVPSMIAANVQVIISSVSPNGDICTDTLHLILSCDGGVGTAERPGHSNEGGQVSSGNDISIFPNPTENMVIVSSSNTEITNIEVIDVNGQKVGTYNFEHTKSTTISLDNLPPGTYLFKVNGSTSKVVSKIK